MLTDDSWRDGFHGFCAMGIAKRKSQKLDDELDGKTTTWLVFDSNKVNNDFCFPFDGKKKMNSNRQQKSHQQ